MVEGVHAGTVLLYERGAPHVTLFDQRSAEEVGGSVGTPIR